MFKIKYINNTKEPWESLLSSRFWIYDQMKDELPQNYSVIYFIHGML